jgi:low temperature requirement protein LtrA
VENFLNLILGTNDIPTYCASLVFALLGVVVVLLLKAQKRDKTSRSTPYQFNFWFLILDNLREVVLGFLLLLLALRFSVEYAGTEITMYYALGLGFGIQKDFALDSQYRN